MAKKKEIEKMLGKIKKMQKQGRFDLSSDEDLSIAVMNLISIEEHLFFTATKTGKIRYLDVLSQVRATRKKLLKKLIKEYEGENWCISKHLLAASMRLNEVGTKSLNNNKKKEAWELFNMAYQLYSLFWGINLGVVRPKEVKANLKKTGFSENEFTDTEKIVKKKTKNSDNLLDKLGEVVKKIIDCCIE